MGRRLIVVSNRRLDDTRSGSAAYLVRALQEAQSAGYDVRFVMAPGTAFGSRPWCVLAPEIRAFPVEWPQAMRVGRAHWSVSGEVWLRFLRRLAIEALRRARINMGAITRVGSLLSHTPPPAEQAAIARAVRAQSPDAVLVEYSSLGPVLADLPEIKLRAVLMHDLFASRAASFRTAEAGPDHLDLSLEDEAARLKSATLVLHASMNELARLAPLLPTAHHVWLRPRTPSRRAWLREQDPACVFIGADHAGNREALAHLLSDIWPNVRRRAPGAKLYVVGAIGSRVTPPETGVFALGRVDDLSKFAGPDMIGLAPVRVGSGVAIKVADYLGAGMPVVGYPGGLDGFGDVLEGVAIRVQTAGAFTDAIVDLLASASERRRRSDAGLRLAERELNSSGLVEALAAPLRAESAAPGA